MISVDNIVQLKKINPFIWKHLKVADETKGISPVKLLVSQTGVPTLAYEQEQGLVYIHSKYDPLKEAETFINRITEEEVAKHQVIFFYGLGLGYHIDAFIKRFPGKSFYLYEPNFNIFQFFMTTRKLGSYPLRLLRDLYVERESDDTQRLSFEFLNKTYEPTMFVTHPVYERLFPDDFKRFSEHFVNAMRTVGANRATGQHFEKRWTLNSAVNLKEELRNKNIFSYEPAMFIDKPAILVSAGPSLEYDIESLRKIRDEGRAYIFTVGSAIKALFANNIHPHAAIAMDPGWNTQYTFEEVIANKVDSIPLIYGTSIGYEALKGYLGPKIYMIMDQDTIAPFYLKDIDNRPLGMVNDAPTVAITALQLLLRLGFSPIILTGQNLALLNNQNYAKGITYEGRDHMATGQELAGLSQTEDVYGNQVTTNSMYSLFKRFMESTIKQFPGRRVINATKGGAKIEDTEFIPLENLLETELLMRVAENNWYTSTSVIKYDLQHLHKRDRKMSKDFSYYLKTLDTIDELLNKISDKIIHSSNIKHLQMLFQELDILVRKLFNNVFFQTFISRLLKVELSILENRARIIRETRDPILQGKYVLEVFRLFLRDCRHDIEEYAAPLLEQIKEAIQEYQSCESHATERD
ncbi:MAG: 6-hydroxymethylpterin diphosphokinase MptE-like protein [Desulfuromonadales bacterium]